MTASATRWPAGAGRRGLAVLGEWWRPLLAAAALCLVLLLTGPSDRVDRRVSDRLLVQKQLPGDPRLLVVEIGPADMRAWGGGPMVSRTGMAALVEALEAGGAQRVMLDINFAEPLEPRADARLEAAMARLGPQRLGLVSSVTVNDRPYAAFARHATILDARLTPDGDGWHRRIGIAVPPNGNNPAIWLARGETRPGEVALDLRVRPGTFERVSAQEVLSGKAALAGRLVVVSVSAKVAPSRAILPYSRRADRGAVFAMASHAVLTDYAAQRRVGEALGVAVVIGAILLGFLVALAARSGQMLVGLMFGGMAVLIATSLTIGDLYAVEVYPLRAIGLFLVMANVTLAQRLKLVPMIGSFLRGDISPEEAWAWRSVEQAGVPVLLLSAVGTVKRSNPAGQQLAAERGDEIARLCMGRPGQRADRIELPGRRGPTCYQIDWPYENVAIAMLRDITEAEAAQHALQRQLLTDELTGKANRRGFDHALSAAAQSGRSFAAFFLDMNGFKGVNDSLGHDAGDELLVIVASRLAALLRPEDTVARLGGDEFALVIPGDLTEDDAELLARRMADAIARPILLSSTGAEVTVGAAVGYALGDDREDPATVLHRADKAMYRDKLRCKLALAA